MCSSISRIVCICYKFIIFFFSFLSACLSLFYLIILFCFGLLLARNSSLFFCSFLFRLVPKVQFIAMFLNFSLLISSLSLEIHECLHFFFAVVSIKFYFIFILSLFIYVLIGLLSVVFYFQFKAID